MRKLLHLNISLTFLLIVWGGVVRNFDAGLACPDWPLCHGKIIPPPDPLIWIEWGHRLLASLVGLLTLVISFLYRKKFGFVAFLPLVLVFFQALLGGATVKGILDPKWVSLHLAVGLLYFASLIWINRKPISYGNGRAVGIYDTLFQRNGVSTFVLPDHFLRKGSGVWGLLLLATVLVYTQAVLGGAVASSGAGLACPDFPTCDGVWLPELKGGVALQFFHRVGGLFVATLSILLVWFSSVVEGAGKDFRRSSLLILFLTVIQVGLGISNVVFKLPAALSILHLAFATLLFANFFILTYKVRHARLS